MEPGRHDVPPSAFLHRLRLTAVCLLLTLLAFLQTPGAIAIDTKVDLTADPLGFLSRALRLWDPQAAFGQLQNQATGYLFPIGPFFALGHVLQLPGWIVQRSWWALLMSVAFLGFVRVSGRLGIGTPTTRVLTGIGFALSPRITSVLGATSIEALPLCLTPWVLLPLVDAAQGRLSARRGAMRSGVAVLCIGGVNAVASLAALPVAGLFLLLSVRGRLRTRLIMWWSLAVLLATLWWLVPLLLLGRYSPPFLSYIESSAVTTGQTSLPEVLRGTSDWIGYLATGGGPVWPAAWRLVTDPLTITNTLVVAGLGLTGLAMRDLAYRAFLLISVLLGLGLVTAGHVGPVDGLLAPELRSALDGALAPFRNVHKFDAVLRLPLLLAACHALSRVRLPGLELPRLRAPGVLLLRGLAVGTLLGLASPLVLGLAVPAGSYVGIPDYWKQTASFLARQHDQGRALLLPGSAFADYTWGSTGDEPLQPLARSPWAVRNGIPLAPSGNIRLLDAVQQRLRHGDGSVGLTEGLLRSGVGLLVVRNDLAWNRIGAPRPPLVHQALADSPGITRIASFGPVVGSPTGTGLLPDAGLDLLYPAVEVFRVGDGGQRVTGYPAATALTVAGGPEALLAAGDVGITSGRTTTLAGQPAVPGASGDELVTDTLRRTEVSFSNLPGDTTTLAADDPFRRSRAAHDYLPVDGTARQTVSRALGVRRLSASSSGSDITAQLLTGAQYAPSAAFDRDATTFWHSGALSSAVGQWLQVDLLRPVDVQSISLALATNVPLSGVERMTVTTDRGTRTSPVAATDRTQRLDTVPGLTSRIRVTVSAVRGGGAGTAVGIRELAVPGVLVDGTLVTPVPNARGNVGYLVGVVPLATDGCLRVGTRPLCTPQLLTPAVGEPALDRLVTVQRAATFGVSFRARARPGAALDALLDRGAPLRVSTSSSATPDAAGRPGTLVDRDLGTGWVAAIGDRDPTVTLRWKGARRVSGLQLLVDPALAASRPAGLTVVAGGRSTRGSLDDEGKLAFPAVTVDHIVVHLNPFSTRATTDSRTGGFSKVPVGASELVVGGLEGLRRTVLPGAHRDLPCGSGPTVVVGNTRFTTAVHTTVGALLDGQPVTTATCGKSDLPLLAGPYHVVATSSAVLDPLTIQLAPLEPPATGSVRTVTSGHWGAESRAVDVGSGAATVLVVHENTNAGWRASLHGARLTPLVVDGWQQAWLVPAGAGGTVRMTYTPGVTYRAGLVVAALAVLALLGLAWRRDRSELTVDAPVREEVPTSALVLGSALLVLAGGPVVVPIVVAVATARRLAGPRDVSAVVVGVSLLATAGFCALDPWPAGRGSQSGTAQVLVLVAGAAALIGAPKLSEAGAPRRWWAVRRSGT